jgi:glycosyltransferase involved in cell wall biosynthesis
VAADLSAIVLGYRSGESLRDVLEPLHSLLSDEGIEFEIVVVANYSPGRDDSTPEVARAFAASRPSVVVLAEPKAGAMGWDMKRGLAAASGEYMVVIDGDAQNPVEDVLRMYRAMRSLDVDVMKGRRTLRHDGTYRRFVSLGYNLLFRLMFRTRGLWDINGKPKGLTRRAYEALELESDDWYIDAEIVLKARTAGLRIAELPVEFMRNDQRASLVRPAAIWEFLVNMARSWRRAT